MFILIWTNPLDIYLKNCLFLRLLNELGYFYYNYNGIIRAQMLMLKKKKTTNWPLRHIL